MTTQLLLLAFSALLANTISANPLPNKTAEKERIAVNWSKGSEAKYSYQQARSALDQPTQTVTKEVSLRVTDKRSDGFEITINISKTSLATPQLKTPQTDPANLLSSLNYTYIVECNSDGTPILLKNWKDIKTKTLTMVKDNTSEGPAKQFLLNFIDKQYATEEATRHYHLNDLSLFFDFLGEEYLIDETLAYDDEINTPNL
jgi:hypothetical protein